MDLMDIVVIGILALGGLGSLFGGGSKKKLGQKSQAGQKKTTRTGGQRTGLQRKTVPSVSAKKSQRKMDQARPPVPRISEPASAATGAQINAFNTKQKVDAKHRWRDAIIAQTVLSPPRSIDPWEPPASA